MGGVFLRRKDPNDCSSGLQFQLWFPFKLAGVGGGYLAPFNPDLADRMARLSVYYTLDGNKQGNTIPFTDFTIDPLTLPITNRAILDNPDQGLIEIVLVDECTGDKAWFTVQHNYNSKDVRASVCNGVATVTSTFFDVASLYCFPIRFTFTDTTDPANAPFTLLQTPQGGSTSLSQSFTDVRFIPGHTYKVDATDAAGRIVYNNFSLSIPKNRDPFTIGGIGLNQIAMAGSFMMNSTQAIVGPLTWTVTASSNVALIGSSQTSTYTGQTSFYPVADIYNFLLGYPKGTYTFHIKTDCQEQDVSLYIPGYEATLDQLTPIPGCGAFDLKAKATIIKRDPADVYDHTAFEVVIVNGPSNIGLTAPLQADLTATFTNLAYGSYQIALRVKGALVNTHANFNTLPVTFNSSDVISIDANATGGYVCTDGAIGNLTITAGSAAPAGKNTLTYALFDAVSNTWTAEQASNIFNGLPKGSYTYRVTDGCGNVKQGTAQVTVAGAPAASANGIARENTLCEGKTLQLDVDVVGATGYSWTGKNNGTNAAVVIDPANAAKKNPLINSLAAGNYTFTVTLTTSCGPITSDVLVHISPLPVVGPIINTGNVCIGAGRILGNATTGGSWSSATPAVATIDAATGKVTGLSAGTSVISYTVTNANGCTTTVSYTLTVDPLPTVAAITNTGNVCIGATRKLGNTAPGGTWSSATPAVATIDANGTVTGVGAGTSVISYTVTNANGCTTTVTYTLTVDPLPTVAVITNTGNVCVGSTRTLANATTGGTWSSATPTVATIDAVTGKVTGVGAGTSVIRYTVTNTNGCTTTVNYTLTVDPLPIVAAITSVGNVCVGASKTLTNATAGGTWSSATPAVATIDANGTVTGVGAGTSVISYSVTNANGCTTTVTYTLKVDPITTITLSSGNGNVCMGNQLANITYTINNAIAVKVTGLPKGVTGSYTAGVFTISGTPSESGTFTYTLTASGNCGDAVATGTITVKPNVVITLNSSSADVNGCINTPISNIVYVVTNSVDVKVTGLPKGLSGSYANGVFTISGTATEVGTFNYTVTAMGDCGTATATGSITIRPAVTLALNGPSADASSCINSPITNIVYHVTGGTNVKVTGLPKGITGSYTADVFTINGTATETGTFTYTIIATGDCGNATVTGIITVKPDVAITLTGQNADASTCINNPITNIVYRITNGTDVKVTGLPRGMTGNYATGMFTISGTPTEAGTFTYTLTATGDCGMATATGTIMVNALPVPTLISDIGISISKGDVATLIASGGVTYRWTGADIQSGQGTNTIKVRPKQTTIYTVTVTNANGCSSTAQLILNVREDLKLVPNNVITPNGDGKNDTWVVKNIDYYPNNKVSIFDRAGRKVFEANNYQNNWDGTYNGQPLTEAAYIYVIDMGSGYGKIKGTINIIRDNR